MIQKAHRNLVKTRLRLVVGNKIQDLFTPIQGVLFIFPSQYFLLSVMKLYLEFEEWFPNIQKELHVLFYYSNKIKDTTGL